MRITALTAGLLKATAHRPFPLPQRPWLCYQTWKRTLFIHCAVDPALIRQLLPPFLTPDYTQQQGWISFVCFANTDMRMRLLQALPVLPPFYEVNVRTYVTFQGIPGIYFLHIKADKKWPVLMNRLLTKLPYQLTPVTYTPPFRYFMTESDKDNFLDINYIPGQPVMNKSPLDKWLTERYCCYQDDGQHLYRYHIHHPEWSLQQASIHHQVLRYHLSGTTLTHASTSLLHYAPVQHALIWHHERVL